MKIITVTGKENTGKTTLIWTIYNNLLENGAEITYFNLLGRDSKDFHAMVVWKGKIIAICSIGDISDNNDEQYIKDGIEMAKEHDAEILLNALSDFIDKKNNHSITIYEKLLVSLFPFSPIFHKFQLNYQSSIEKILKQKQENATLIIRELLK